MKKITGKVFNTIPGKIIVPDQQEIVLKIGEIIEYEGRLYRFMGVPMLAGATSETKISLAVKEIEEE